MIKRLSAVLVGVLALAGLVAGCGSSSDSTSSNLTKTAFIKQADAICKKTDAQNEKEYKAFAKEEGISLEKKPSKEVQEKLVEEVAVPGVSQQLEQIRELGFPEGKDGEEGEAVIEAAESDLEKVEEDPSALFTGKAFADAGKKAHAYGFKVCGSES